MKLSQILEGGGRRISDFSDEELAKALSTQRNPISPETVRKDRSAYEEYYSDKASEYMSDAAGEGEYDEEEEEFNANLGELQNIAEQIFQFAEGKVADRAGGEGGQGFTGDAVQSMADEVLNTLKGMVDSRVAQENS